MMIVIGYTTNNHNNRNNETSGRIKYNKNGSGDKIISSSIGHINWGIRMIDNYNNEP